MSTEKIWNVCGIDIVIDDSLAPDEMVLHNANEAIVLKGDQLSRVRPKKEWRDYSLRPTAAGESNAR